MKDIVTPVPPEEVRAMIKKSLENAALDNYTRLSSEAKIEGKIGESVKIPWPLSMITSSSSRGSSW